MQGFAHRIAEHFDQPIYLSQKNKRSEDWAFKVGDAVGA